MFALKNHQKTTELISTNTRIKKYFTDLTHLLISYIVQEMGKITEYVYIYEITQKAYKMKAK